MTAKATITNDHYKFENKNIVFISIGESEFITCDHLDPRLHIIQIELYVL